MVVIRKEKHWGGKRKQASKCRYLYLKLTPADITEKEDLGARSLHRWAYSASLVAWLNDSAKVRPESKQSPNRCGLIPADGVECSHSSRCKHIRVWRSLFKLTTHPLTHSWQATFTGHFDAGSFPLYHSAKLWAPEPSFLYPCPKGKGCWDALFCSETDGEQISDNTQKVQRVKLQMTGQENGLNKDTLLDMQKETGWSFKN